MLLGLLSASTLHAQDGRSSAILEEIVVTADKRGDQSIQDIPITVQAMSGDQLAEIGALDFNDYYRMVPGLSVNDQGPGQKKYIIRGISSSGAGTVGVYFDETVVTGQFLDSEGGRQPDIKLFDMNRIEVLKGPQGTTFGSSSLSGTIRWIPNYPKLNEFEADVGGTLSSTEGADLSWTLDGMVNVPLVQDRLALRLAATAVDREGYVDTRFGKGVNGDQSEAVRAMLAFQATDNLLFTFTAMTQNSESDGRSGHMDLQLDLPTSPSLNGGPTPGEHWNNALSVESFEDELELFNLKAEYKADWGNITATGSRYTRDTEFFADSSAEIEIVSGYAFSAEGTGRSTLYQPQDRTLTSGELRFASDWNGPVQLLIGGFTQKEERDFRSAVLTVDSTTGKVSGSSTSLLDREVHTEIVEVAAFAELTWQATERLALTGGVRAFDFDLDERAIAVTGFPGRPGAGPGAPLAFEEDGTIFKLNVAYDFTDDVLGYALFSQGFRAGGTNDPTAASIAGVAIPAGFGSDSIENYEIGFKSTLMGDRLVFNAAACFIEWSDIQVRQTAGSPTGLRFAYRGNGGAAEVKGLEFELNAYLADRLQIGATLGWSDAKLTEDLPLVTDGRRGDTLPYAPEYTASLSGRYEFPFLTSLGGVGFVGADITYQDEQVTQLRPTLINYREVDSSSVVNMRLGVEGDAWSAILGVNNVFDEDETTAYTFSGTAQPNVGYVPPGEVRPWPRTVFLSLRRSF